MSGTPMELVSKLLGHSTVDITEKHYNNGCLNDSDRSVATPTIQTTPERKPAWKTERS